MRLIEGLRVDQVCTRLSSYLRRLPKRLRGQGVVEYGIIVAVIAVASIIGFNALSAAEKGYFQGMRPGLAPTAPTFSPFVTPVPPTSTPVPTSTPIPTNTSTPVPTNTPIPTPTPVVGTQTPSFILTLTVPAKSVKNELDLSWTVPSGTVTAYSIYRGTTSGLESWVNTVLPTMTSYSDTGLSLSGPYYYYVVAMVSGGSTPRTNERSGSPN